MRTGKLVVIAGASSLAARPIFSEADSSIASKRPLPADRKFRSAEVETYISSTARVIRDPVLRAIFTNCFPNTLDTTVVTGNL